MPFGKTAEDIVTEAILKIYEGERAWSPDRNPDLLEHLKSIIDSDLNHLAEGSENRTIRTAAVLRSENENGSNGVEVIDNTSASDPSPDEEIIKQEDERQSNAFLFAFIDFLNSEKELITVVECIMDGLQKPKDIARKLTMNVLDVNNLQKKMRRRLWEFQKKWHEENKASVKGVA